MAGIKWNAEELNILKNMWGSGCSVNEIMQVLPHRSHCSIEHTLTRYGISCDNQRSERERKINRERYEQIMKIREV